MHGPLRSGIVWDLDHTLYKTTDAIVKPWLFTLSRLAVERGLYADTDTALQVLEKSSDRYGHCLTQIEMDHDIDTEEFIHTAIEKFGNKFAAVPLIEPCDLTVAAITSHGHIPQVILTSAHRDWARRVIERIRLDAHFPDQRVIVIEDSDYKYKSNSRIPFERAAEVIGLPVASLIMVEDNINNLVVAKELGMGTVLVTHGDVPAVPADHVDFIVNKAYDVFTLISQGHISWANGLLS